MEDVNNPNFKYVEFDTISIQAGDGQYADLSDVYASYNQFDDFYLTADGIYFINQCKI